MFIPNQKHTIDHLKELKDEVKELHPILNVLFRKLPDVERVYYNQGSEELGADFILFKRDNSLLRTTHIGVVVKVGSLRQNTSEVERQIKECFIQRRIHDATEVQIREVWVVSSQEITRNAREVLAKQFSDRKIEFIGPQDLAGLIDRFSPDAFVTTSPALQNFAESALAALDAEDQRSLIVPGMEAFYVEPRIIRKELNSYGATAASKSLPSLSDLLKIIVDEQFTVIEAGAGGGKSRLARELTKRIINTSEFADGKILPIILQAKDVVSDTEDKISAEVERLRSASMASGRPVIFLDGFDEIDIQDAERSSFVDRLISAAGQFDLSVVLLSRPFDEVSTFGGRVRSIRIFRIEPLKGARAIAFLRKVASQIDVKNKLVDDLNKSVLMRALDGAPIAYILLGRLIAENQHDLPSNLTELFQKYTELVLGRWEISKGLRSQQEFEVLVEGLIWLSAYLLDNNLTEVARSEFEDWIREYCKDRSVGVDAKALVNRVCDRNSILYVRSDNGAVGFRHRAFSEFFYAKKLSRSRSLELNSDVFSPYWLNTYYFFVGIQRDCPDLLRSLLEIKPEGEAERLLKIFNFGNLLLAGYLTPTSVCSESIQRISLDVADLFLDGCNPSSNSLLTQFPTIQLLCLLTTAFRDQYGYRHFRSALEESIFALDAEGKSEKNAIAIFLLDVAYKEAGGDLLFDKLIQAYGDSLPLTVKLAMHHESDRMKVMSDRVRKMERNLRRALAANKGSKDFLHKLYDIPVRGLEKKLI